MAVVLNKHQFDIFLKKNSKVVVMYSAKGCAACQSMMEAVNYIATTYSSKVKLCVVYPDQVPSNFSSFPTFVGYHNGKRVFEPAGFDLGQFKTLVKNVINLK